MEQRWDPEVKKYFRKILTTIGWGLLWIMVVLTAGLYFGLAWHPNKVFAGLFYVFCLLSFAFLLRFYYRNWKK